MLITDSKDKSRDPDPVLVLNDQGGGVMNVSDKPSTLRAQMKHHEPIVCFEPGVAKREGGGKPIRDRQVRNTESEHGR